MFDVSLYGIHTAYPFIWEKGEFPEALKIVRDIHIVCVIPSTTAIPDSFSYTLKLMHLSADAATIYIIIPGYATQLTVPVKLSSAISATDTSYITVDEPIQSAWGVQNGSDGVDIHPDCLLLLQEAPKLTIEHTIKYNTSKQRESQMVTIPNNLVLKFANGHNVTATGTQQKDSIDISLDCGSGNGKGVWNNSPWNDKTIENFKITGLRSINGVVGTVNISDAASVAVTATKHSNSVDLIIAERNS